MGTMIGNLLALVVMVVCAATGFFSFRAGAILHCTVAYMAWVVLKASEVATRPARDPAMSDVAFRFPLTPTEMNAYRAYHTYLIAPGAGQAFSAFLNGLRLAGFAWAAASMWYGSLWIAVALVVYFFLVSGLIVRMDPGHYMPPAAANGNSTAIEQLALIEAVHAKRERYNAIDQS